MPVTPVKGRRRGTALEDVVRPAWYTHRFNRAGSYRLAHAVGGVLPRPVRVRVAAAASRVLAPWFSSERAVVQANVARIAAASTARAQAALVRAVFRNFAICFADLLTTNRDHEVTSLLARVEGEDHLRASTGRRRGLIVLTAHLGNWELAGRLLAQRAARPTHVVVAAEADPEVERMLRGPASSPVHFVVRDEPTAALPLVAALRRDEVVALQGDRGLGNRGDVSVPFFGAPASFPLGPFVLARASGASVVPAFCIMQRDRRYAIQVGTPMHVGVDGERAALAHWVSVLETMVRRHPDQWFTFFDPWSQRRAG
jgi:KDO2-lipid IV(A) lauroyltransferase